MGKHDKSDPNRPPAYLPDGRKNPEYRLWYKNSKRGRAVIEKWRTSEKGRKSAQQRAARWRPKYKAEFKEYCKRLNMSTKERATRFLKTWTKEEDDYVLRNHGKVSMRKMALKLGRTWRGVEARYYWMKAGRPKPTRVYKKKEGPRKTKHNWHLVDWSRRNRDIAAEKGLPMNQISWARSRYAPETVKRIKKRKV